MGDNRNDTDATLYSMISINFTKYLGVCVYRWAEYFDYYIERQSRQASLAIMKDAVLFCTMNVIIFMNLIGFRPVIIWLLVKKRQARSREPFLATS